MPCGPMPVNLFADRVRNSLKLPFHVEGKPLQIDGS